MFVYEKIDTPGSFLIINDKREIPGYVKTDIGNVSQIYIDPYLECNCYKGNIGGNKDTLIID